MADAIIGVADLVKKFKSLDDDIKTKTGRRMVASAAGVIKRQARQNVMTKGLVRTKALLNNIAVKRETKAPANTIQYNVGVRHGRELTRKQKLNSKIILKRANGRIRVFRQNDPFYWRFVHEGHKTTASSLRNKGRAATRSIPPEPFLKDAAEQKYNEAIAQMGKVLDKELLKAGK
ncbi:HK97-gp10 family putative phage morphogenesis protein [Methylophilus sp. Leaf414]|uniref:HK97-gp10 family putative phage morphogenesis protein n=1 Tax=Methylophilus sp. Leaf414 TaxID=1736371 RepID=UPI0006FE6655|nr:HK97-gp10 family putative phage morphogenesis protein [Methylophilus sp. Leaf414]KQT37680.1 hypothetical protein ASG24_01405 [Methylophilus sp. Leaf414]